MSSEGKGAVGPPQAGASGEPTAEAVPEVAGPHGLRDLLVILREPDSPAAESLRLVRTSLQRHLATGTRGWMVLSPWSGDGKSMVCANLAASLSQLFLDVLLVDADLRKPTLTRVFRMEGKPGLTDCLEQRRTLDEVIQDTGVDRLRFVPAGASALNPADLLGRDLLGPLIQDLQSRCQCVLVDTSPLTACGDALLLGAHMPRALMVLNPKNWQGEAEARVRDLLKEHGVEIQGVVLNASDDAAEGSGYGYGYGYGYGNPGEPDSSSAAGRRPASKAGPGSGSSRGGTLKRLWERLRGGGRERE